MSQDKLARIGRVLFIAIVFAVGCETENNDYDKNFKDDLEFWRTAPNRPIQEIVAQTFVLQNTEALLVATRVAGEMQSPPYTVFTPWDNAFKKLSYWDKMTSNSGWYGHLRDLMLGHIHQGNIPKADLTDGMTVTMLNGDVATISMEGGRARVDGILTIADTAASDGYLYMLDEVRPPRWQSRTVLDVINADQRFSVLAEILNHPSMSQKRAELQSAGAALTFFAPTNDALRGFRMEECVEPECSALLDLIVGTHLVDAVVPKLFTRTQSLSNQAGSNLEWNFEKKTIACTGEDETRQETGIGSVDEEFASNGIVYPMEELFCITVGNEGDPDDTCTTDVDCADDRYCTNGNCEEGCRQAPDNCTDGLICDAEHKCVDDNSAVIPERYSANRMQGHLFNARNNVDWAHLGDDKIKFPVIIEDVDPKYIEEFGQVTQSDKDKLKSLMQDVINEFVSYLYGRYGFNVRHVTLFEIDQNELDGIYYNNVRPLNIGIAPKLPYAGLSTGGNNYVFKMKYVVRDDYYSGFSTSEVVRHEFGHGWGLWHDTTVPSCVYGAPGFTGSRLRIYGNDIIKYTSIWRKESSNYNGTCPQGYLSATCLSDIQNMYRMRIRNKGTGKCLSYSSDSAGTIVEQDTCDDESLNQQWDIVQNDEYGRYIISPRQSNFTLSIHSEDLSNNQGARMELGFDEEYSPWYMIANEDGTWMLQQTETVQVMGIGDRVEQRLPIGNSNERWYIEPVQENLPDPDMPTINTSQSSLLFEDIVENDSESQNLVIRNDGSNYLEIMRLEISGNNASDFRIGNSTCSNNSMAPGKSCSLSITFSPDSVRLKEAKLLIRSNDPLNSRLIVVLSGNAVNEGFPHIQYPWNTNRYGRTKGNLYLSGDHREVGWRFTPKVDGQITKLGGAFNGENTIKLINLDTSTSFKVPFELDVLATAIVGNNHCNRFVYTDIEPVPVKAGTNYAIFMTQEDNFKYCRAYDISLPQDFGGEYGITITSSFDDYFVYDFALKEIYDSLPELDLAFMPDETPAQ